MNIIETKDSIGISTPTIEVGERDYNKLVNDYAEFELPKEIKQAFKQGMGAMFGGCLNRAKVRMFHIEKRINNDDLSYVMGLPPQRLEGEDFPTYKNRQKLARIFYRDRVYLRKLTETRPEQVMEEQK